MEKGTRKLLTELGIPMCLGMGWVPPQLIEEDV